MTLNSHRCFQMKRINECTNTELRICSRIHVNAADSCAVRMQGRRRGARTDRIISMVFSWRISAMRSDMSTRNPHKLACLHACHQIRSCADMHKSANGAGTSSAAPVFKCPNLAYKGTSCVKWKWPQGVNEGVLCPQRHVRACQTAKAHAAHRQHASTHATWISQDDNGTNVLTSKPACLQGMYVFTHVRQPKRCKYVWHTKCASLCGAVPFSLIENEA